MFKNKIASLLFTLLVMSGVVATHAWAQETRATLGGKVTDAQSAIVPNAEVVVTSDDTGVKQRTKTNGQENWAIDFLLPGHYSFSVTARGFKQAARRGLTLQTADNKLIDTQLEIGP